jgi:hypothetical protein
MYLIQVKFLDRSGDLSPQASQTLSAFDTAPQL